MKTLILILLLSLTSCATNYQSGLGSTTGGFYEERISENNYLVKFQANGFTNDETAFDFALLRSLEIGYELNFKYMLIQGSNSAATLSQRIMTLPTTKTTYGYVDGTSFYGTTTSSETIPYTLRKPSYNLNVLYIEYIPSEKFLKKSLFDISEEIQRLRKNIS